jgi:hypothetical protein
MMMMNWKCTTHHPKLLDGNGLGDAQRELMDKDLGRFLL